MANSSPDLPTIPMMSGALQSASARSQSKSGSHSRSSNDHVHSERINSENRDPLAPFPSSFFTAPIRGSHPWPHDTTGPSMTSSIRATQIGSSLKSRQARHDDRIRPQGSSLDALLRHPSNGHVDMEGTQVPLSESRSSGTSTEYARTVFEERNPKSSLEIIAEKGIPDYSRGPFPSSIPLPGSTALSLTETGHSQSISRPQSTEYQQSVQEFSPQQHQPHPPSTPEWASMSLYPYELMIAKASGFLKHIEHGHIQIPPRLEFFNNVSYTDYSWVPGAVSNTYHLHSQHEMSFFSTLGTIPDHVKQRLVVVEDLCPRTINLLGRLFGVSPEFFEEHLINSGYGGPDYNDQPAHTWTTSGMKKSFISMRWHRPVIRLPVVPFSENDLKELLDPDIGRVEYSSETSRHLNVYETETNILRSEWALWTDPATTTRMKRVCGWEERVSVWSQKLVGRDCQIVIVLLDPLPTLQEAIEKDVFTETSFVDDEDFEKSKSNYSLENSKVSSRRGQHALNVEESKRPAEAMHKHELVRDAKPTWARRFMKRIRGKDAGIAVDVAKRIKASKKLERIRSRKMFRQYAHRTHLEMNYDDAFRLPSVMDTFRQQLSETRSTAEDLLQGLPTSTTAANEGVGLEGALEPLFRIIYQDSTSLLKLLHNSLDAINMDILDDVKMEDRLSMWRQLITRAQLELPELKHSAAQFLSFVQSLDAEDVQPALRDPENGLKKTRGHSITEVTQSLCRQIDNMMQRLQTASSSLTSNMALLDSRRSIAEAQAVTKLTELAFFFIPLGFAATLFGMQIEQFENRAPLWVFVVIGLGFVAASYLVRLIIRSTWLRNMIRASKASIKVYADSKRIPVQRGSVPASLFIRWTAYEVNGIVRAAASAVWRFLTEASPRMFSKLWESLDFVVTMSLVISVPAAAPIAVLWTRNIDHGVKIMITIVILICIIGIFGVPYWRYTDPYVRSAIPSLLKRKLRVFRGTTSRTQVLFVVLCAIAIGIILLSVIWTRPISPGIRAAVTVFIVLIVILSAIGWGIYRLVSIARIGESSTSSDASSGSRSLVSD